MQPCSTALGRQGSCLAASASRPACAAPLFVRPLPGDWCPKPTRRGRIPRAATQSGEAFVGPTPQIVDAPGQLSAIIGVDGERIEVVGVEDWEKWCPIFEEMDSKDRELDQLDAELDEAVSSENYNEAARLKREIVELEQSDPIVQAESRLESALAAEDYSEAARVRDEGLMHLVGWWSGIGDHEDCHGHLLRVFSRYGRYYGVAYSARDIADSIGWRSPVGDGPPPPSGVPVHIDSLGMPVLEIFLNPDHKGGYRKKAAYLLPLPAALDTDLDGPDSEFLTQSREGAGEGAGEGRVDLSRASWKELVGSAGAARRGQEGREGADPVDEEWKNRALEARLQMLATTQVPTDMERVPAVVELIGRERFCVDVQLGAIASAFDRDAGPAADASPAQPRGASSGSVALPPGRPDRDGAGAQKSAGRMDLEEGSEGVRIAIELSDEDLLRMGLSASALQQISGGLSEAIAARVQAEMQAVGEGQELSEERVAELVSETVQEVAQRYRWHEDSAQPRDAAAPATSASPAAQSAEGVEAQAEGALERMVGQVVAPAPSRTTYRKLKPEWSVPSDPFTGLYLGTFGPHGPELLRLERGRDEDGDECVTATKVTGDVHVPAGEVSFQAKVGRNRKLDARGVYPEQLGIAARFKGRGRIADTGFKDPQWTEGELVQFTSSARREVTSGAELGFMWSIAHRGGTQRFLILLNRVNLDLERAWH